MTYYHPIHGEGGGGVETLLLVVKHRLSYSVKDGLFYSWILILDCSLKSC